MKSDPCKDIKTDMVIKLFRISIKYMDDHERVELIESLMEGYCMKCGKFIGNDRCYCDRHD